MNVAGTVNLTGQNAVAINASLIAGSAVALAANQDGAGSEGFTQATGTSIQTTSTAASAHWRSP